MNRMSIRMSRNMDNVVVRAGREYEITDRRLFRAEALLAKECIQQCSVSLALSCQNLLINPVLPEITFIRIHDLCDFDLIPLDSERKCAFVSF